MDHGNSNWEAPITGLTVIPAPQSLTGTITSDGKVVTGSGTDFLNELEEGDWIWDSGQAEVRQIQAISSRLEVLYLKEAFTADIAAPIALEGVPDSNYEEISLLNAGAGGATIDGNPLAGGEDVSFDKKAADTRGRKGFISPKVVDGTGTQVRVLTIR